MIPNLEPCSRISVVSVHSAWGLETFNVVSVCLVEAALYCSVARSNIFLTKFDQKLHHLVRILEYDQVGRLIAQLCAPLTELIMPPPCKTSYPQGSSPPGALPSSDDALAVV